MMNKRSKNNSHVSGEVVILALCIVLVMITLSQILVVHHKFNGRFHGSRNPRSRNIRNRQELRQLEKSIATLMRQHVPSIEEHSEMLRSEIYASRTSDLILRSMQEARKQVETVLAMDKYDELSTLYNYEQGSDGNLVNLTIDLQNIQSTSNSNRSVVSKYHKLFPFFENTSKYWDEKLLKREKIKRFCPLEPQGLLASAMTKVNHSDENVELSDILTSNLDIMSGGHWRPTNCVPRYRVAIIIPYRDRLSHLIVLLAHLIPVLKRQDLDFRIFVVEQNGNKMFNKGRIMNAAFKEALKIFDFQCAVFHDVDLIPEDDRNMYTCPQQPRHLSVAIDEMNYKLGYDLLVGGVLNMRVEHYKTVNGYSNMYVGWGAEDDDMAYRILHTGLKISRPPENVARYKMIRHTKRKPTSWGTRHKLLNTAVKRYKMDGLNSVKYKALFIHEEPLYTHIMVDIDDA